MLRSTSGEVKRDRRLAERLVDVGGAARDHSSMRTAVCFAWRVVAGLLVFVVVLVVGVIAVSAFYQPVDGVVVLLMLGVLGGVPFLIWIVFKTMRRIRAAGVGASGPGA